ncbi:ATP-binding protein [Speluncibacter jeojiensis]|uniref:ATP-binding protein n=1 Tax=Speluncibacter jeojiensis TaxID=2710754 RepID=A0A9X4RCM8_9ACTN|nr:ATP-binding protein [Corynebacteriales bacterium D3-21]
MSAAHRTDDPTSRVELRLAAVADRLPILRAATEAFALVSDLDIDAVTDLKLAVDEACSELMSRASAGAELSCILSCNGDGVRVTASAALSVDADESSLGSGFGWHVLRTLTDEARISHAHAEAGVTVIEFVKRR